jgi:hypothetical protein
MNTRYFSQLFGGFVGVAWLAILAAKIFGRADEVSWWVLMLPFWIGPAMVIALVVLGCAVLAIMAAAVAIIERVSE